jgi:hypothetical protein
MSLRLQVSVDAAATPDTVWAEMTDWARQGRWIPFTTVRSLDPDDQRQGVRIVALSGFWLGKIPVGLLDRFVVTGWRPPVDGGSGELEVLHLGPYFTGEGVFRVEADQGSPGEPGSRITATEIFTLPGGRPVEAVVGLLLPVMRTAFRASLRSLKKVVESSRRGPA